jgi:hypothetical protein
MLHAVRTVLVCFPALALPAALTIAACDAGTACTTEGGTLDDTCSRGGLTCVETWSAATDAATWCGKPGVSSAYAAISTCLGYRVVVVTKNGESTWYYYDQDGGLVGIGQRNEDFQHLCVGGRAGFRIPDDCAASRSPSCCRFDFGKNLGCVDAGPEVLVVPTHPPDAKE